VRQLSIFAPRAQGLTAYIERHRPDGALLPPAAEFPVYWLDPHGGDWIPVEEKNKMSWGVQAVGKAPAVAAEIERQFSKTKCSEPEESVRQAAILLVSAALSAQDPSTVVKVGASGSQITDYTTKAIRNQLSITIEPLYGFME
jgi:hypothetical protein